MGWASWLAVGDWATHAQMQSQARRIASMRREMTRLREQRPAGPPSPEELQRQVDELRLLMAAILRLLAAKGAVEEQELRALVEALDAEDGNADGRLQGGLLPKPGTLG